MQHCYSRIGIQALNIPVPFSSTYLCECGFSALLTIKFKAKNRLRVQSDIRCALSTTLPEIEKLICNKTMLACNYVIEIHKVLLKIFV